MSKTLLTLAFVGALLAFGGLPAFAQQEKSAAEVFAALDSNRDGKLSQAEFSRIFEMEGNSDASAQEKQQAFKAWDADGDGAISKAEFTAKYEK
jgi:Ca2+-binding EF-hand superfamily protein